MSSNRCRESASHRDYRNRGCRGEGPKPPPDPKKPPNKTSVVAVDELLALVGSKDAVLTVAVYVITAPTAGVRFTTSVSTIVSPEFKPRLGAVQVTVPVPPAAGAVQDPELVTTLLNVVPAGSASTILTFSAVSGPLLATVIV